MSYIYGEPSPMSAIPDAKMKQIASRMHIYSTALFRLWLDDHEDTQGAHIGSGTFVEMNGAHGILTAQHVAERLRPRDSLGLSVANEGEEHAMNVRRESIAVTEVAKPELDEFGPDLAFIALADWNDVTTIKSSKGFHRLDPDRDELLNNPPPQDGGIWFFCGAPGERMLDQPSERGFLKIKAYQDLCLAGGPTVTCQRGDFDYFDLDSDRPHDVPSSFAGMSGGGLWQVTVTISAEGELVPSRYLFSGVSFYEGVRSTGARFMRCHGRRSIYECLYQCLGK